MIGAKQTGTDRIELYTEAFAWIWNKSGIDPKKQQFC
jgi:hypothetical protein